MTVPLLGPMTLSGFEHAWFFLFLLVVLGLIALYIVVQLARRKRMLRFANMELLESVAPKRSVALAAPARDPAGDLAGVVHGRDGRAYARCPDSPQPRGRDARDRRVAVHAGHRRVPDRLAAAQEAAKQFAGELTPGINLGLISYAGTATVLVSPTTNRDATKPRSTICSSPTARPPVKASSPHCRRSPRSAR